MKMNEWIGYVDLNRVCIDFVGDLYLPFKDRIEAEFIKRGCKDVKYKNQKITLKCNGYPPFVSNYIKWIKLGETECERSE